MAKDEKVSTYFVKGRSLSFVSIKVRILISF